PTLPAPDQRESRAVQPHPARRMGLRAPLLQRDRPPQSPTPMATHLQSPPTPHRTRRQTTHHPRHQRPWAGHLVGDHLVLNGCPGVNGRAVRRVPAPRAARRGRSARQIGRTCRPPGRGEDHLPRDRDLARTIGGAHGRNGQILSQRREGMPDGVIECRNVAGEGVPADTLRCGLRRPADDPRRTAMTDPEQVTYRTVGVDYDLLDAGKREALAAALSTSAFARERGAVAEDASRGESAFVMRWQGQQLALVLECLGTKSTLASLYQQETGVDRFEWIGVD